MNPDQHHYEYDHPDVRGVSDAGMTAGAAGSAQDGPSIIAWTALRADLRYLAATVTEIKRDVHETNSSLAALMLELAKLPSQYATVGGVQDLAHRVDSLEATRDAETPKALALMAQVQALATQVAALSTFRERTAGGVQWFWVAFGTLFTVLNLAISAFKAFSS